MDFYGFGNQQKRLCACGGGKDELVGNSAGVLIVICLSNNSELFWGGNNKLYKHKHARQVIAESGGTIQPRVAK